MLYKHIYTGEVIDIPCTLVDANWEQIKSAPAPAKETKEEPVKKKIIKKK